MSETLAGWHPYETIPQDGTSVVLWDNRSGIAVGGYWDIDEDDWSLDVEVAGFCPTHWIPLPPAPKEGDDE